MAVEQSEVEAQTQDTFATEQPDNIPAAEAPSETVEMADGATGVEAEAAQPEETVALPAIPDDIDEDTLRNHAKVKDLLARENKAAADKALADAQKSREAVMATDAYNESVTLSVMKRTVEARGGTWDPDSFDARTVNELKQVMGLPNQIRLAVAIEQNFDELAPAVAKFMGGTEAAQKALLERVTEAKTVGEKSAAIGVLLTGAKENIEAEFETKWKGWAETEVKRLLQAEIDAGKLEAATNGAPKTLLNTPKGAAPGAGLTYENMTKMTEAEIKALPSEVFEKVVNGG